MKRYFILIIVLVSNSIFAQQQSKFIIGADWLNPTYPHPYYTYTPLSNAYWDTIRSFGLNFGTLNLNENLGVQNVRNELNKAYNKGIDIELYSYTINYTVRPRRWLYQIEDYYEFYEHYTGVSRRLNDSAETHWSKVKDIIQWPNYWELNVQDDNSGYAVKNLIHDSQIPDGASYIVKLRIRKTDPTSENLPVVTIYVMKKGSGSSFQRTIYADELPNNVWREDSLFSFYKSSTGPLSFIEGENNIVITDSIFYAGVEDYRVTTTYTPYDIQIYWHDQVSCDLDYVLLEDLESYKLHKGAYDNIMITSVNNFMNHNALTKIKIWDEPFSENFLPIRYQSRLIDNYLSNNGYGSKHTFAFNNYRNPQEYLAKTELKTHRSNIYPIWIDTPIPGDNDYYPNIQYRFNGDLIPYISDQIVQSNKFDVPYWFTLQAHSWDFENINTDDLREPSAFEIKAMVNLGICYGAKGIQYFMFSKPYNQDKGQYFGHTLLDNDNPQNPIPRYIDNYGNQKWNILKSLNQKLSVIGETLIQLTWQNAFRHPSRSAHGNVCDFCNNIRCG